jgi:predicted amidophosphoribosyltransferase
MYRISFTRSQQNPDQMSAVRPVARGSDWGHGALQSALDVLLPASCPACGHRPLPVGNVWCTRCDDGLPWRPQAAGPPSVLLDSLRAALDFRAGPTRTLLHHLKYRNRPELAYALGQRCAERFLRPPEGSILLPVPITNPKKRQRGYNQAERFAAGLASVWECPVEEHVLVRRIQHQSLTELDRAARLREARNAFVLADGARNRCSGRSLVLVDDTLTTGATLGACAVALAALRPPFLGGFCAAWAP